MAAPSDPQPSQNSEQKVQAETDALLKRLKDVFSVQDATSSQLADHKKLLAAEASRLEGQLTKKHHEIEEFSTRQQAKKRIFEKHQEALIDANGQVAVGLEKQLSMLDSEVWDALEALFAHTTNAQHQRIIDNVGISQDHLLTLTTAARGPEPDLATLAARLYYIKCGNATTPNVVDVAREAMRRWREENRRKKAGS